MSQDIGQPDLRNAGSAVLQLRARTPRLVPARTLAARAKVASQLGAPVPPGRFRQLPRGRAARQVAQALVSEAWAEVRKGAARVAITAAAEGVQLAGETRHRRFVVAGQLAQAIAALEMGADEPAERLIDAAEAMLLPLGANPLLALVALARGRQALADERFAEAYAHLLRIFDPKDAAHHQFVGGWVLPDLADAARQGNGDREVVDELLREWDAVATATGAPHLEVQLRYTKAILADEENAEPFREDAMSVGAAGWPFYAARAVGVRRLAQTAAPHGRVAGAAA